MSLYSGPVATRSTSRNPLSLGARPNRAVAPPFPALCRRWVLPSLRRRDIPALFARPPAAHIVFVEGGRFLQYRIDDPPRFLDVILSCKQRAIAIHGVAEHAFICI